MTFAEIKARVRGLINRSDMSDADIIDFIRLAQMRLERRLRLSFMQKFVDFNVSTNNGVFRVPVDYLELIDLFTETGGQMERVDTGRLLKYPASAGVPEVFTQNGHDIRMRPYPSQTDTLFLEYFGCEPVLELDDDVNQWSLSAPDGLIYGAAELAADHFEDERLPRFATRFNEILLELTDQQQQEDFSGPMSIQNTYAWPSND